MTFLKVTMNKIGFGRTKLFFQEIPKFGFSTNCVLPTKMTDEQLRKRQKELMAKSLPKKRRLPGVKNVILVSLRRRIFRFNLFFEREAVGFVNIVIYFLNHLKNIFYDQTPV